MLVYPPFSLLDRPLPELLPGLARAAVAAMAAAGTVSSPSAVSALLIFAQVLFSHGAWVWGFPMPIRCSADCLKED